MLQAMQDTDIQHSTDLCNGLVMEGHCSRHCHALSKYILPGSRCMHLGFRVRQNNLQYE